MPQVICIAPRVSLILLHLTRSADQTEARRHQPIKVVPRSIDPFDQLRLLRVVATHRNYLRPETPLRRPFRGVCQCLCVNGMSSRTLSTTFNRPISSFLPSVDKETVYTDIVFILGMGRAPSWRLEMNEVVRRSKCRARP